MKRVILFGTALAVMLVPSASAGGEAGTRVTLDNIEVTPTGTIWTGDIFSPEKKCKNERRVLVYRVRDGADQKRGSTLSYKGSDQPGYFWSYDEEGIPPSGKYYAKVRATDDCEKDRSPKFALAG